MQTSLQVPRVRDAELIRRLGLVAQDVPEVGEFHFRAVTVFDGQISMGRIPSDIDPGLKEIIDADSEVLSMAALLVAPGKRYILNVSRQFAEDTDTLNFDQNFINERQAEESRMLLKLWSSARRHFRALDAEVSMTVDKVAEMTRFQKIHSKLIGQLEQSAQTLIVDTGRRSAELDAAREQKFNELDRKLRDELDAENARLTEEHLNRMAILDQRSSELDEKWKAFERQESHLVARQRQKEQEEAIRNGLKQWSLTKGTTSKRWPITLAYATGILGGAFFAWMASSEFYRVVNPSTGTAPVEWWKWLLLSLKIAVPFAISTTCLVYFIRWSSAWARIHAEEELRNRSLLIDIGRSSWLLETVRDAQERKGEIPLDLLKELSRNLFSYSKNPDGDIEPTAFADVLLQGLSSIRVKTPEGTEVEARRGK